jgi:hypothetical protein
MRRHFHRGRTNDVVGGIPEVRRPPTYAPRCEVDQSLSRKVCAPRRCYAEYGAGAVENDPDVVNAANCDQPVSPGGDDWHTVPRWRCPDRLTLARYSPPHPSPVCARGATRRPFRHRRLTTTSCCRPSSPRTPPSRTLTGFVRRQAEQLGYDYASTPIMEKRGHTRPEPPGVRTREVGRTGGTSKLSDPRDQLLLRTPLGAIPARPGSARRSIL